MELKKSVYSMKIVTIQTNQIGFWKFYSLTFYSKFESDDKCASSVKCSENFKFPSSNV